MSASFDFMSYTNGTALLTLIEFPDREKLPILFQAIEDFWLIQHYATQCRGVKHIHVSLVQEVSRPVISVKVDYNNGGESNFLSFVNVEGDKINLVATDLPNVMRCSTNPEVRQQAQTPC